MLAHLMPSLFEQQACVETLIVLRFEKEYTPRKIKEHLAYSSQEHFIP